MSNARSQVSVQNLSSVASLIKQQARGKPLPGP